MVVAALLPARPLVEVVQARVVEESKGEEEEKANALARRAVKSRGMDVVKSMAMQEARRCFIAVCGALGGKREE